MSISLTPESKNSITLVLTLRNGKDPRLEELKNFTFNDVVFEDGSVLKDLTFNQLSNAIWTYESKNSATSLTLEAKT